MIYVQARYYLASFIIKKCMKTIPKKYRLIVAVWAMEVATKTILWKLKSGHKS
jgi:hypothetical protein